MLPSPATNSFHLPVSGILESVPPHLCSVSEAAKKAEVKYVDFIAACMSVCGAENF